MNSNPVLLTSPYMHTLRYISNLWWHEYACVSIRDRWTVIWSIIIDAVEHCWRRANKEVILSALNYRWINIKTSKTEGSIKRNFKGVNRVTIDRSSFTTNYSPKSDGEQQTHRETGRHKSFVFKAIHHCRITRLIESSIEMIMMQTSQVVRSQSMEGERKRQSTEN